MEIKEWGGGWVGVEGNRKEGMEKEVRGEDVVVKGGIGEEVGGIVEEEDPPTPEEPKGRIWSAMNNFIRPKKSTPLPSPTITHETNPDDSTVHVFSLATGHLYERFLKIMVLSVTSNTKRKVKFWLLENYLSPQFKKDILKLVTGIGAEVRADEKKGRSTCSGRILTLTRSLCRSNSSLTPGPPGSGDRRTSSGQSGASRFSSLTFSFPRTWKRSSSSMLTRSCGRTLGNYGTRTSKARSGLTRPFAKPTRRP